MSSSEVRAEVEASKLERTKERRKKLRMVAPGGGRKRLTPPYTETATHAFANQACARWPLRGGGCPGGFAHDEDRRTGLLNDAIGIGDDSSLAACFLLAPR